MGFGPLRVINDDRIAAGRGFGMHPHRDMEIITVMVEGALHHRDSMGHSEVLRAGEVQRMSAGTGIVHSEMNDGDRPCRLLQIWIEPEQTGVTPVYEQRPFSIGEDWTLLLDPRQQQGAMAIHRPVRLWRANPVPGSVLSVAPEPERLGWLQVISGQVQVTYAEGLEGPSQLDMGDGLGFVAGQVTQLQATGDSTDLLLFELN